MGRVTVAAAAAVAAAAMPGWAPGSMAVPVSFILAGVRLLLLRRRKRDTWMWRMDRLFYSALL